MNDTYYEHAYIARYLGFMLLEGEDLTVRDGALMVRTVAGLQPVSVLWRRLDAIWADPLELERASRLGTPGLLGAIRNGSRDDGQCARLGRPGNAGVSRVPAAHLRGVDRRSR